MTTTLAALDLPLPAHRNGDARTLSLALLAEPRDLWVGVYWTRTPYGEPEVYLCLVPMLPLRIRIARTGDPGADTEIGAGVVPAWGEFGGPPG